MTILTCGQSCSRDGKDFGFGNRPLKSASVWPTISIRPGSSRSPLPGPKFATRQAWRWRRPAGPAVFAVFLALDGLFRSLASPGKLRCCRNFLNQLVEERITVSGPRFLDPRDIPGIHPLRVVPAVLSSRAGHRRMIPALLTPLSTRISPKLARPPPPPPMEKPTKLIIH